MVKKIRWSVRARQERLEILEYWANRNRSKAYSAKLSREFLDNIDLLPKAPFIGKSIQIEDVRFLIVRDYLIYYQISDSYIDILAIWDSRRDPKKFKL
jgi:plasmid stabilization system protein ParE